MRLLGIAVQISSTDGNWASVSVAVPGRSAITLARRVRRRLSAIALSSGKSAPRPASQDIAVPLPHRPAIREERESGARTVRAICSLQFQSQSPLGGPAPGGCLAGRGLARGGGDGPRGAGRGRGAFGRA